MWPNFFIVGAPRSGTTSLYEYLKEVPEVFMCPVKEPNFFNPSVDYDLFLSKPIRDKKKYLKLFKNVEKEKAIGEASPTYLWDPKTPKLIHEIIPGAKIIIILRDPITRAFSEYLFLLGLGSEKGSFLETIKRSIQEDDYSLNRIIQNGLYFEQIKRYLEIFGTEQIKILIFEELVKDPTASVKKVLQFLDIHQEPSTSVREIHNAFSIPRSKFTSALIKNKLLRKIGKNLIPLDGLIHLRKILTKETPKPTMTNKEKNLLMEYYYNDVRNLEKLLNRQLHWQITEENN